MICNFCSTKLYSTAPAESLKENFFIYVCNGCQPHEVIYRKLYTRDTNILLASGLRIDEYHVIIDYKKNKTIFNKDTIINIGNYDSKFKTYSKQFYELVGVWEIPSIGIEMIKNKLQLYTTFL